LGPDDVEDSPWGAGHLAVGMHPLIGKIERIAA
jgi:hypothetical protein